jgi:deoxycytidine triphosphate deaminase
MLLTKQQVIGRTLVVNGAPDGYRDTTYDTKIEEIIVSGRVVTESTYTIKSRGVVWVISKEEFNLADDVTGVAALKTSLAHDGLFALNVGVIDPGWKGPVATALVNFSRDPVTIYRGQAFLRVMFLTANGALPSDPPFYKDRPDYVRRMCDKSKAFSNTFLNMADLANEVGRDVMKLPKWAYVLTIIAAALSFASVFAPMAYTVWTDGAHNKETISDVERRLKVVEEDVKKESEARQKMLIDQANAASNKAEIKPQPPK